MGLTATFNDHIARYAAIESGLRRSIAEAAKETDTEPTLPQRIAGNYSKGRFRWNGVRIVIENPKGSIRRGAGWEQKMTCAYGYFSAHARDGVQKSEADGDAVDVFVGPDPESELVFIVDQVRADGTLDEHKALLGFVTEAEAREAYLSNYPAGWGGLGAITALTLPEFREWLENGDTRRPVARYALAAMFAESMARYANGH